jgi:hypothetical protein
MKSDDNLMTVTVIENLLFYPSVRPSVGFFVTLVDCVTPRPPSKTKSNFIYMKSLFLPFDFSERPEAKLLSLTSVYTRTEFFLIGLLDEKQSDFPIPNPLLFVTKCQPVNQFLIVLAQI